MLGEDQPKKRKWNFVAGLASNGASSYRCSSSPLADDGLLLTSTSHDRPKHGLETIMIFGNNKSDVKNHLSPKHSLFTHRLFVEDAPKKLARQLRDEEYSAERSPPERGEEPEGIHFN